MSPLLRECAAGAHADGTIRRALAFATSAFGPYSDCRQYRENIEWARAGVELGSTEIHKLRTFHDHPRFIEAMPDRVREALDTIPDDRRVSTRYLGRFQRDSKFSTWISRIMINQWLTRLRKARQASFLYLDEGAAGGKRGVMKLPDSGSTPEAELGGTEMSTILHREIRRISPILRSVLVLRDLEELPMDDVAVRLGITLAAAKSRLMRAARS